MSSGKSNVIVLVGLMGAGKTTVGRQLAKRLKWRFADSDHEIEQRTGVRIPLIFDIEGEVGFRRREASVIDELLQADRLVLATGGGAVLSEETRRLMKSRAGLVAYLCVPPDLLFARTRHDKNRPLLQVADPLARLQALYVERDPLYREVADLVLEGAQLNARQIAAAIETEVSTRCVSST